MQTPIDTIQGENFSDFEGFVKECNRCFIRGLGGNWNGSLDAFNDYLTWADGSYILNWTNSTKSQSDLGYVEMTNKLMDIFERCHPSNRKSVQKRIRMAEHFEGPTLYDLIIEIIQGLSDQVSLQLR